MLALEETSLKCQIHLSANKTILVSELSILRILNDGVNPTVTYGYTLQVKTKRTWCYLLSEVISDSGNVMAGIAFTSDVKVAALILRVLFKETVDKKFHGSCDLIFIGF